MRKFLDHLSVYNILFLVLAICYHNWIAVTISLLIICVLVLLR